MPPNDGAILVSTDSIFNEYNYDVNLMPPSSIVDDFETPQLQNDQNSGAIGFDGMYEGPRFFRKFKQVVDRKEIVAEISWHKRVFRYLKEEAKLKSSKKRWFRNFSMSIRMYCGSATFENSDEDPTGCFELWPSEEIAALLACTRDAKIFDGKNVCELAAGASGLFGLVLAAANPTVKRIHLTDGSLKACEKLRENVMKNRHLLESPVTIGNLEWMSYWEGGHLKSSSLSGNFDLVFANDCLHLIDFHQALLATFLLLTWGRADARLILLSPTRRFQMGCDADSPLKSFLKLARHAKLAARIWLPPYDRLVHAVAEEDFRSRPFFDDTTDYPLYVEVTKEKDVKILQPGLLLSDEFKQNFTDIRHFNDKIQILKKNSIRQNSIHEKEFN